MPTYVYETIPDDESETPIRFEVTQRFSDPPLTVHPKNGQKVRRVITGGLNASVATGSGGCCSSDCNCGD